MSRMSASGLSIHGQESPRFTHDEDKKTFEDVAVRRSKGILAEDHRLS